MGSFEPVNIVQTVHLQNEKAFESHRAEDMNVELAGIPQAHEEMLPNQENWQQPKAKTLHPHELQ